MAYISGRLQNRTYEAKDGTKRTITEIIVNDVSIEKPQRADTEQARSEYHAQPVNAVTEPQRPAERLTDTLIDLGKSFGEEWDDLPF